jgi:ferrous iron transport protein B
MRSRSDKGFGGPAETRARDAAELPVLVNRTVPLTSLMPGDSGRVAGIAPGRARERLMEMGITAGTLIELVRFAPLGDPVDVRVRGYRLSLRRRHAEKILVHPGACDVNCPVEDGLCRHPECPRNTYDIAGGHTVTFAMLGNPNCGKTTLFNALTGLRQKVGNYPGVTVEKKQGEITVHGRRARLLDLPGLYGLSPQSPDEAIARDVLLGKQDGTRRPDAIINVVDANNLERNLLLTSQLMDLGLPMLVVLTMTDVAKRNGIHVDAERLERALGVPVRVVVAPKGRHGLADLRHLLSGRGLALPGPRPWRLPDAAEEALADIQRLLLEHGVEDEATAFAEAVFLLSRGEAVPDGSAPSEVVEEVRRHTAGLREQGIDFAVAVNEARYAWIGALSRVVVRDSRRSAATLTDRVDSVLLHPWFGYAIFFGVMALVFHVIFTWAAPGMNAIGAAIDFAGGWMSARLPEGDLRDLLVNGVLGGVGTTLMFLPQILLLFFFVGLLEDTGYMARAAFLMDRVMSRVGLHGRSFIPLVSSFACAIPGILATRTIDNRKARLATIMVAPLMSCSARLPVYALMIAATIPAVKVFGLISLPGLTLLAMYLLGIAAAFGMSWLFRRTLLKGESNVFLLELPPYRAPHARTIFLQMLERTALFVRKATTVILSMSVVLWFLSTYPKTPNAPRDVQVANSFAGRVGRLMEPAIRPLGFDWRIGISILSSFAAREVFVSSMATIYNVEEDDKADVTLTHLLQEQHDQKTGRKVWTPLLGIAVMVYYVLAMQCISTIAVVRRETGGWKWPLFQVAYMTALAYVLTLIVYQGGKALGLG